MSSKKLAEKTQTKELFEPTPDWWFEALSRVAYGAIGKPEDYAKNILKIEHAFGQLKFSILDKLIEKDQEYVSHSSVGEATSKN